MATQLLQVALSQRRNASRRGIADLLDYIHRYWRKTEPELSSQSFDIEELFTLLQLQRSEAESNDESNLAGRLFGLEHTASAYVAGCLAEFSYSTVSSPVFRALGHKLLQERAPVITFNYDTLIEEAIEVASMPRAGPADRDDRDLSYSHFNWNRALDYGFQFAELQIQKGRVE